MRRAKKEKIKWKPIMIKSLYIIFLICIFLNLILLLNANICRNDYFKIFGISFFRMNNNLMEDEINKNDLVIVKEVDGKELQEGDVIAYRVNGNIRINKIFDKQEIYTTKSNKNYQPDIEKINEDDIIGKKIANIRFLGILLEILQSMVTSVFVLIFLCIKFIYNKYTYITKKERNIKKGKMEK